MSSQQNHILMEVAPRLISLGGSTVHRLLPYAKKRMVGPFIFFDYFPNTEFDAGKGMDVRPHPHIGLSTLSYLLEGEVLHHDSLGNKQLLTPGDVNWMTAGQGISHSERQPGELSEKKHRLHLLQFWVALPLEYEDTRPSFTHHPQKTIPTFKVNDSEVTLVAGSAFGYQSPVETFSPLFFMDVRMKKGQSFKYDPGSQELAFFLISGEVSLADKKIANDDFVILEKDNQLQVTALQETQMMVLGGEAFAEPRHIYWNFVSSSKEKIEKAKVAWQEGSFPQVPGEVDIIPLPAT